MTNRSLRSSLVFLLMGALTACGDDVSSSDSGTGTDAGTSVDSGVGSDAGASSDSGVRHDSGTSRDAGLPDDGGRTDAGTTADAGGDVPALVAACQTRASLMATNCSDSDSRPCSWNAYRELCALGQTQLLLDSMECLSADTCRTFSDPNESLACLDATHEAGQSATARAVITALCESCGGSDCDRAWGAAELLPYLSDADLGLFEACRGTACTLDDMIDACRGSVPGLAAFEACF